MCIAMTGTWGYAIGSSAPEPINARYSARRSRSGRQPDTVSSSSGRVVVADADELLIVSGTGDVLEPDNRIAAIGSGSMYAQSAAVALKKHAPHLSAEEIVRESLSIAADICIYTNHNIITEKI